MEINIVAGGPAMYIPDLRKLDNKGIKAVWIGVDRGSLRILEAGIHLDAVFGDFDSISKEELKIVQENCDHFFEFPPEKDATDLELALEWAYTQSPERIKIYGASGGRMDHAIANIMILSGEEHMQHGIPTSIVDQNNILTIYKPGTYVLEETEFKYISFIPITDEVGGMTLQNFKYPLTNRTLHRGSTLSVSNELNFKTGTFSFLNGILLVVRSRD